MLIVNSDNSIELTRGDTARLTVPIKDDSGAVYEMQSTDVLIMTVKNSVNDKEPCFQKIVTGSNEIHIKPGDTAELNFGKYVYDVELRISEDDVYTIIEKTTFKIREEVTTR
jgi:hypothetical protein